MSENTHAGKGLPLMTPAALPLVPVLVLVLVLDLQRIFKDDDEKKENGDDDKAA
jgi:hypothetical protein